MRVRTSVAYLQSACGNCRRTGRLKRLPRSNVSAAGLCPEAVTEGTCVHTPTSIDQSKRLMQYGIINVGPEHPTQVSLLPRGSDSSALLSTSPYRSGVRHSAQAKEDGMTGRSELHPWRKLARTMEASLYPNLNQNPGRVCMNLCTRLQYGACPRRQRLVDVPGLT